MAAIDTVTGISLLYDSVYEVTSNVTIGTVDDLTDATLIIRSGGLLRFGGSCATTFTRCTFIETDTAYDLGFDHYYKLGNDAPRWDANCTAVFKGCKWLVDTGSAFDTHGDNACTWEKDDYGNPCYFLFRSTEGNGSTFQISLSTVDGVVFDMDGEQLGLAGSGVVFNDFNYTGTTTLNAVMTFPYPEFSPGGIARYVYSKLKAPSVTVNVLRADVAPNEHSKSILQLIDPIGRIEKAVGSATNSGVLEVYRTWENSYLDATTGAALNTVRALIHPVGNVTDVLYDVTASSNTYLMKQFSQAAGSETVVTEPDYVVITMEYGYLKQIESIAIGDTTNPDAYKATKLLFSDPKITETNEVTVAAYSVLDDAAKFYDGFRYWEYSTPDYLDENAILSVVGSTLNWSDHNIYFGNFTANISHFGADYVAPSGTVGDEASNGLTQDAPTNDVQNEAEVLNKSIFSGWANYARLVVSGLEVSTDGTKAYTLHSPQYDSSGMYLVEWTLSTAFDLSTIAYSTVYLLSGTQGVGLNFTVSSDGTKFTFMRPEYGYVRTVDLSTAWDLTSTITDSGQSTVSLFQYLNAESSHYWNDDGTRLYIAYNGGAATEERIYFREYSASTAYDFSSCTLLSTFNTPAGLAGGSNSTYAEFRTSIRWVNDGNQVLVFDPRQKQIGIFDATTAYDLSSTNYTDDVWMALPNKSADTLAAGALVGTKLVTIDRGTYSYINDCTFTFDSFDLTELVQLIGAPDSIFVNVGTNGVMSATATYDTLQTTGTVNFLHGTSTDMTVVDANGTLTSIELNGIDAGSRIQLYNVTKGTELVNDISATDMYTYQYYAGVAGAIIATGDVLRVRATKLGKLPYENTLVSGDFGGATYIAQENNTVYTDNAIDGSTVTEFSYDLGNVEIDVNDPDGQTTVQRMYAWYQYFLTSETGIRDGFNGFVALDAVNYEVQTAVLDMNVQNVGTNAVIVTGGRFYRDDGQPIFIAGNGAIQMEYGRAYAIDSAADRAATFGGKVYVNNSIGSAGTSYPQGLISSPVDNLADAISIANTNGLREIIIETGLYTLSSENLDRFKIIGLAPLAVTLSFTNTGESCADAVFEEVTLTGAMTGQDIRVENCKLKDVTNFRGLALTTAFDGSIEIAANQNATLVDCFSDMAGTSAPTIDMNSGNPVSISIRRYSGGMIVTNCDHANDVATFEYVSGKCELQASCTAGLVSVRGVAKLTDNSAGTTVDATALVEQLVDLTNVNISGITVDIDNAAIAVATRVEMDANSASLNTINEGVKKASLLIPHTDNV